MEKIKIINNKKIGFKKTSSESNAISYRLKCARTANGLSHFVMYGDVSKKETLL